MKHKLRPVAKYIVFGLIGLFLCLSTQRASAGCTITAKITSHNNVKCYGDSTGSAVVTPTGGIAPYKYLWSPFGGTKDTASGLPAGLYIVTVTDSMGCIAKDTVSILQPDSILALNIVSTASTCGKNNGSATANAAGGTRPYKYAWSPTGGNNATANNLAPGTYTCVVTDSNNCTIINSTIITGTGGPAINITPTPDSGTCSGTVMANVTGGTSPYTYSWSPGHNYDTLNNLCPGTYCCIVTDAIGCKDTSCGTVATVTGINQHFIKQQMELYPDPASNYLVVKAEMLQGAIIEVYDITGRIMLTNIVPATMEKYRMEVEGLKDGIYLLKLIEPGRPDTVSRFKIMR